MRTELQKLTVECPATHLLAKVEVRCKLYDSASEGRQERRVLEKVLHCTFATPEIACHPACEAEIRRLVEY